MANILIVSPHETERSRIVKLLVSDGYTFILDLDRASAPDDPSPEEKE